MAGIPLTRNLVPVEKAEAIRAAVCAAKVLPSAFGGSILAEEAHAAAFHEFLSDPAIHAPIYSLPAPLDEASVRTFIRQHIEERDAGEGLLFLGFDEVGEVAGYSDIQVWPQWAAAELGGALRADRQSSGQGAAGAKSSFEWLFNELDIDLICETASLENVRTARLLDALGFARMGEITSTRTDGTTRPSRVWEITREAWAAKYS